MKTTNFLPLSQSILWITLLASIIILVGIGVIVYQWLQLQQPHLLFALILLVVALLSCMVLIPRKLTVTQEAIEYVNAQGFMSVCISEKADTPIAREAGAFIDMGCGREEYPMRTIGYSTTVFTLMLLGLELGCRRGTVSETDYAGYMQQAAAAAANIPVIISDTESWVDRCKRRIMKSAFIAFTTLETLSFAA